MFFPDADEDVIIQVRNGRFSWQEEDFENLVEDGLTSHSHPNNESMQPQGTLQLSAINLQILKVSCLSF